MLRATLKSGTNWIDCCSGVSSRTSAGEIPGKVKKTEGYSRKHWVNRGGSRLQEIMNEQKVNDGWNGVLRNTRMNDEIF